jgi:uncharacterized membrane protein
MEERMIEMVVVAVVVFQLMIVVLKNRGRKKLMTGNNLIVNAIVLPIATGNDMIVIGIVLVLVTLLI